MKKFWVYKIAICLVFVSNLVYASDKVDELHFGTNRIAISTFAGTFFSDACNGNRLKILASLAKHSQADVFFSHADFQKRLLGMSNEGERNVILGYIPFEIKNSLKGNVFNLFPDITQALAIIKSIGQYETDQAKNTFQQLKDLEALIPTEQKAGIMAQISGGAVKSFISSLIGFEEPQQEVVSGSFFVNFFSNQQSQGKEISAALTQSSILLTNAKTDEDKLGALGKLNYYAKLQHMLNYPSDYGLESFLDENLFCYSYDCSHLDLTRHFLEAAIGRDGKVLDNIAGQYKESTVGSARQGRLAILLDTLMLKVQIMAASYIVLTDIIDENKEDLINDYFSLANFFHKYVKETIKPFDSGGKLPALREELLTISPHEVPALLSAKSVSNFDETKVEKNVGHGAKSGGKPGITIAAATYQLQQVANSIGKLVVQNNSTELADTGGGVNLALYT